MKLTAEIARDAFDGMQKNLEAAADDTSYAMDWMEENVEDDVAHMLTTFALMFEIIHAPASSTAMTFFTVGYELGKAVAAMESVKNGELT